MFAVHLRAVCSWGCRCELANFDEVMYADDTIIVSTDTRIMNRYVNRIEEIRRLCGLQLNKDKCETVYPLKKAAVKVADGSLVPRKDEVKYLGCLLNQATDYRKELGKQINNNDNDYA